MSIFRVLDIINSGESVTVSGTLTIPGDLMNHAGDQGIQTKEPGKK